MNKQHRATRRSLLRRPASLAGLGVAFAIGLAACSSSSTPPATTTSTAPSNPTTTAPADPASQLAALIKPPSTNVALTETGSTLLYPLFGAWAPAFNKAYPTVSITTAGTGSGAGIAGAAAGTVDIGASDAYLPAATVSKTPGLENIPLAISAQQINYNIPGLSSSTHLKLDAKVLNDIYAGTIANWNATQITALNPGVKLPSLAIAPLHRSDSSGDTFLFSTFLAKGDPSGWVPPAGGESPSITFPTVKNALAEKGNSGMVAGCKATPGCVAYIGISYLADTQHAGLGEAMLQNRSGAFLLPSSTTILAEAASFTQVPASGAISLIYGPASGGYPIINFEYAIVLANQSSATKAAAIRSVLAWAMDPTQGSATSYLSAVNFQPLPAGALQVSVNLLKKIS